MDEMQKKLIEMYWDDCMEKMLEDCLKKNETLRTLFEEHPEKKEEYKFKILDSGSINDWHNNAIVHNPVGILGEAYGCRTKRKGNREHCHEYQS